MGTNRTLSLVRKLIPASFMAALVFACVAIPNGANGAANSSPASTDPVVNLTFQWGASKQASTAMPMAEIPDEGEIVDTFSDSFTDVLKRQWVVTRVIHTPGSPFNDALIFLVPR